jgi:hypothetical protein
MTLLRRRMTEDMQVRNFSPHTQDSYVQQVSLFARYSIAGPTGPGTLGSSEPASALEIARLRRELEFVTRQRDILKKALGILGQDSWNSSKWLPRSRTIKMPDTAWLNCVWPLG